MRWSPKPYVGDVSLRAFMCWLHNGLTRGITVENYRTKKFIIELRVRDEYTKPSEVWRNHIKLIIDSTPLSTLERSQ